MEPTCRWLGLINDPLGPLRSIAGAWSTWLVLVTELRANNLKAREFSRPKRNARSLLQWRAWTEHRLEKADRLEAVRGHMADFSQRRMVQVGRFMDSSAMLNTL